MTTSCHAQRTRALSALTGVVVVFVACLAGLPTAAQAATVQVEVLDAAGRPLPDAVVFLESADARKAVKPLSGAEMAQEKRQFVPGVLVVPVGTEVRFPNHDSVRHHVYSFSPAKKFELKLYTGTPSNPVLFDRTGVAVLGCNIHDQMVAYVSVVDTPWFAVSGNDGAAQIRDVPPGDYQVQVWHPRRLGMPDLPLRPLRVAGDLNETLAVELKP